MQLNYKRLDEKFIDELQKKIIKVEDNIEELLEIKDKTYDNFFDVMEHLLDDIEKFSFPLQIEISTDITDLGKKIYEEYIPIMNEFTSKLSQNEEIADSIIKIYETENLSDVRKRILEKQILSFKSSGIGLDQKSKVYKASATKAPQNEELIEKILKLRNEKAKILGYENYRELSIASKTANNATEVIAFLTELGREALPKATQEIKELKSFAVEKLGYEDIEIYDYAYLSRKLKEIKYNFNPSEVKPYFEKNKVIKGMFQFLDNIFNLKAKQIKDVKLWNNKALVFELERNGVLLGNLIMDLETNTNKRGGAWADSWITSYIKDGIRVPATGIIVCNFPPSKDGVPSLLDHSDVVTLFHEMGHALHLITSKTKDISASGFNGTEWDVVEYPSQWLQEFANNKEIIKTFGIHYETREVISDELIQKILDSLNYGQGYGNNRQVEFGLFDLMIYDNAYSKKQVQEKLDEVRKMVSVIKTPSYNKFQCSFSHIFAGGYGAGYYSYKWAEVLSADSYIEMTKDGNINKKLANNFFDNLLSLGGSVNMKESFVNVHGRQPDPKALLKLTGILD
ncbi:MAG: hypothetical protein B6227_04860 [Fusobacteriia bacterium 4572_74]|nr:MAG: hypothetical protein B6227_04860 [Fusobacteriia bacterium 4572_74]